MSSRNARSQPDVVVITGASAGVGRATARAFAQRGARIGLLARGRDGLEGARQDVEALGGNAMAIPTDVADANQVERAAELIEGEFGPIDTNVAGMRISSLGEHGLLWYEVGDERSQATKFEIPEPRP